MLPVEFHNHFSAVRVTEDPVLFCNDDNGADTGR